VLLNSYCCFIALLNDLLNYCEIFDLVLAYFFPELRLQLNDSSNNFPTKLHDQVFMFCQLRHTHRPIYRLQDYRWMVHLPGILVFNSLDNMVFFNITSKDLLNVNSSIIEIKPTLVFSLPFEL